MYEKEVNELYQELSTKLPQSMLRKLREWSLLLGRTSLNESFNATRIES